MIWVLISLVQIPGARVPMSWHQPHSSRRKHLSGEIPPYCVFRPGGGDFCKTFISLSYPFLCSPFSTFYWEQVHLSVSEGNDPYVAVGLLCPKQEMSLGSSYTVILDTPPSSLSERVFCYKPFLSGFKSRGNPDLHMHCFRIVHKSV